MSIDTGNWRYKLDQSFADSTPDAETQATWQAWAEQGSTLLDAYEAQAARIAELEQQVEALKLSVTVHHHERDRATDRAAELEQRNAKLQAVADAALVVNADWDRFNNGVGYWYDSAKALKAALAALAALGTPDGGEVA